MKVGEPYPIGPYAPGYTVSLLSREFEDDFCVMTKHTITIGPKLNK